MLSLSRRTIEITEAASHSRLDSRVIMNRQHLLTAEGKVVNWCSYYSAWASFFAACRVIRDTKLLRLSVESGTYNVICQFSTVKGMVVESEVLKAQNCALSKFSLPMHSNVFFQNWTSSIDI